MSDIKVTPAMIKALNILIGTSYHNTMKAKTFAKKMWPDSWMHKKTSNQGNGACSGKAAWLCGGAYLRKLEIKNLVTNHDFGYYITSEGLELVRNNKKTDYEK